MQTSCIGGGKTVSDAPTDPTPKDGHRAHDRRGVPDGRPRQENWGQERTRHGETEVGEEAYPGGAEATNRGQGSIHQG